MSAEAPAIHAALAAVMADVQGVAKKDRNKQQGFDFRGIDAVLNAVGPALRTHQVVVLPEMLDRVEEQYASKHGAAMTRTVVTVRYAFSAVDGSSVSVVVPGEASDAGDKAVSKAMSVALRTALIQTLALPTDEPDPDSSVHERAVTPTAPAFTPEDRSTWPTKLTVGQAKAVLVAHHDGDKDRAAAMWAQLDAPDTISAHWLASALDRDLVEQATAEAGVEVVA